MTTEIISKSTAQAADNYNYPIIAGQDEIFWITYAGLINKWSLRTFLPSQVSLASQITNSQTFQPRHSVYRKGYIWFDFIYTKSSESAGSRHIYYRWCKFDPVNMTITSLGTERMFPDAFHVDIGPTNKLLDGGRLGFYCENATANMLILDFDNLTGWKPSLQGTDTNVMLGWETDRASGKMYLLVGEHFWLGPDGAAYIKLYDPVNMNVPYRALTYIPGSGMFGSHIVYEDLTGKTRRAVWGTSGGYGKATCVSRINLMAVNNPATLQVVVDATQDINDSFISADVSNRFIWVVGETSGGKLQAVCHGAPWGGACTELGVSHVEVDSLLQTPTNKTESLWTLGTYKMRWIDGVENYLFLSERDWCYYFPLGIYDGYAKTAKISLPDLARYQVIHNSFDMDGSKLVSIGSRYAPSGGSYNLAGVTKDQNGNILGSCITQLFRESDKLLSDEVTSDPTTGAYSFAVPDNVTEYFVRAYKDTPSRVFGITDRNLKGA